MEIINKFKEEVRHNKANQINNQHEHEKECNKKVKQREELRNEMLRVLEMKRKQKLQALNDEYKYYL